MENNVNCETIKNMAAESILEFNQHHNTACVLSIKDGFVVATALDEVTTKYDRALMITHYAQNVGLTMARWNLVGNKLFNLYEKEQKCRPYQKHST